MALARIDKTSAQSTDGLNITTTSINTTGANLIVVAVAYSNNGTTITLTDNKSNTWTPLTARQSTTASVRLYYCLSPTVGSGHTFSVASSGGSGFPGIAVAAYSGAKTSGAFDQETGANSNGASSLATGSITPAQDNELFITGFGYNVASAATIDSGFTAIEALGVTANAWGIALGELIETTATAKNPTWTQGASVACAAGLATFKDAATSSGKHRMFAVFP